MDKGTFASYKFKSFDVIEGLNRYFADAKANRYRRVPLEIRNGTVKPGNYYVFRNLVFDVSTPKIKECGYGYILCDPEEVVGVAINWLREEHDIFYIPGMEVPREDCDVDEAAKEYEKATRTSEPVVPVAKVRGILGINPEVDFFEALKCARGDMDATTRLRLESSELRHQNHQLYRRLADIRKAAGMAVSDPTDLVKYIKNLREANEELSDHRVAEGWLRKDNSDLAVDVANLKEQLRVLRYEILKVYREIFDCSNGDPEGSDEEVLQDILTEYKRTLELKNVAEEKTIKYKELARENEDTAKENRVQWNNTKAQLQWAQKENLEWVKRYEALKSELNEMKELYRGAAVGNGGLCEDLTKERERTKRLEQKLIEIQDICER